MDPFSLRGRVVQWNCKNVLPINETTWTNLVINLPSVVSLHYYFLIQILDFMLEGASTVVCFRFCETLLNNKQAADQNHVQHCGARFRFRSPRT